MEKYGSGTVRSHRTVSCEIHGPWVLRTEAGWAGLELVVEGA